MKINGVIHLLSAAFEFLEHDDGSSTLEMRLIAVIEDPSVIEKILRHLKLWCGPARFAPVRPPPSAELREPEPEFLVDPDPMPDYDNVITD